MKKKYKLIKSDKKTIGGKSLYQIKALFVFGIVKKGEFGGYIEKEVNLSHSGDAWVSGDAQVYGNAWVSGDARVYGNAQVYGNARVSGRFDLIINCDFELQRITIDTKKKLDKLEKFLDSF